MHLYVLTNKVNGKRYVGQTIRRLRRRLYEHSRASCNTIIARAIRKHGWENFAVDSCEVDSLDDLNELEEFMIDFLGSHCLKHGYNAKFGGGNHGGQPFTKETRAKISANLTGRPVSEETRKKMSESNKLWKRTPEQIAKQAAAIRGRKHTKEHNAKISASNMGRAVSDETRAKISAANKGKKRTPEMVEAMRQRQLGHKHSAETRAKMKASRKERSASKQESAA